FIDVSDGEDVPADGAIIVSLAQWRAAAEELRGRDLGIRLRSDEPPELIADDLSEFSLIALEFPVFRDGRAYSYARILRETHGYSGELRAVGDVLLEQLHFMIRVGFDAFELHGADPEGAYRTAAKEFSAWYQPGADSRPTAMQLRLHRN
ncbi:MAG: DUF934 domain-containing protein, partial [Gammaproteobacteria bacterium]